MVRRGRPIAGIVTVTEARALWTLDHESAVYAEWRAMQRLDDQTRRRAAVTRQAEAERRAAFEKAVLGHATDLPFLESASPTIVDFTLLPRTNLRVRY